MNLILLGAPGSGKGTQSQFISKKLSIPTVSTGNILRAAVRNGTPIGKKAKSYMDAGSLVPDDIIIGMIKERIAEQDCKAGCILDGMPRTIAQAEALEAAGVEIDFVIEIQADEERILARMSGRRSCPDCGAVYHIKTNPPKVENVCDKCGGTLVIRADDQQETMKKRLLVYHEETEPLIEFYRSKGILISVVDTTIKETAVEIFKALGI
ncbi:MAG: adenylate kinase [Clostridiales bacterium]|nr:adenylate kinase [Clostridiales bacterium]